jgi:hypothetical protein
LISDEREKTVCEKGTEYPAIFMLVRVNKHSPRQFLKCFDDNITLRFTWFLDLIN